MHEAAVKRLPVVDPDGRVLGVVARADLLRVFLRPDDEIGNEIESSVIDRTFRLEPGAVRADVSDGVVTLRGPVDRHSLVQALVQTVRSVAGVVGVDQRLTYEIDDLASIDPIAPWRRTSAPARR
jgi:osmotically-inducible protein OsmY